MNETLGISLPQAQINALTNLFNYIENNNLPNISLEQFAEKLRPYPKRPANKWLAY